MGQTEYSGDMEAMKEMIQREIQSIAGLKERVAFKELMEGVFLSLYETNQQMYSELEQRVQENLTYDQSRYRIKTGIIEREYLDESHHLLSPMDDGDMEDNHYDMKEIQQAVREQGAFSLMKVMLCCDYLELQTLWENPPVFKGIIETEQPEKEWEIEVRLQKNESYLKKLVYLYRLFIRNGIPWQTVNAPYLYKMADVVITKLPEEIAGTEKIRQVSIQFGDYSRIVSQDLIPVWNIQKIAMESVGFPRPCEDHVTYEHTVSLRAYGSDNAYLAEDDQKIQGISQNGEKLRIISENSEAKKWNIYMIRSSKDLKIDRYTYPIMQNGHMESFADNYQKMWNQSIRTKTELIHFIKGFGLEDYVCYQDCEVWEQLPGRKETYSMNSFIPEEVRDTTAQKKLVLHFSPGKKETWLQRDILSFLVSEVQRIYPEYDCGGVLQ